MKKLLLMTLIMSAKLGAMQAPPPPPPTGIVLVIDANLKKKLGGVADNKYKEFVQAIKSDQKIADAWDKTLSGSQRVMLVDKYLAEKKAAPNTGSPILADFLTEAKKGGTDLDNWVKTNLPEKVTKPKPMPVDPKIQGLLLRISTLIFADTKKVLGNNLSVIEKNMKDNGKTFDVAYQEVFGKVPSNDVKQAYADYAQAMQGQPSSVTGGKLGQDKDMTKFAQALKDIAQS